MRGKFGWASLTLAVVTVLPTLEALCAAWASRACASRLGWDRRLGAFHVVTLVSRRAGCVCLYTCVCVRACAYVMGEVE